MPCPRNRRILAVPSLCLAPEQGDKTARWNLWDNLRRFQAPGGWCVTVKGRLNDGGDALLHVGIALCLARMACARAQGRRIHAADDVLRRRRLPERGVPQAH